MQHIVDWNQTRSQHLSHKKLFIDERHIHKTPWKEDEATHSIIRPDRIYLALQGLLNGRFPHSITQNGCRIHWEYSEICWIGPKSWFDLIIPARKDLFRTYCRVHYQRPIITKVLGKHGIIPSFSAYFLIFHVFIVSMKTSSFNNSCQMKWKFHRGWQKADKDRRLL